MSSDVNILLLLLALGLPVALLFQRLGISTLVAYLVTGAIAGPGILGWVKADELRPLADVGASLLLFTLGLDMDVGGLRKRGRVIALATVVQVGLTMLVTGALGLALGLTFAYGLGLGACLAMSSSLLLLRALDERRLRNREEGQISLAVSLMQDVCLGPLLVLLSFLLPLGERPPLWLMSVGLLGAAVVTFALRRALASALLTRIRAASLPELEVAFAMIVALGAAAATHACGLGSALGAFCAGLAFGAGDQARTVEAAVRPLQGLTAIFFFVATGVFFDPRFVWAHLATVTVGLLVSVVFKAVIATFALRLAGLNLRSSIGCGILLGNIGEFSFVLALAVFGGSADPELQKLYRLVVAITFLSFLVMPILVRAATPFLPRSRLDTIRDRGRTVVVAGLGPVGNTVVDTLRDLGHPLLLVDRNPHLLKTWREVDGVRCHQGRIEDMDDWLPALGHRPALVVLTFPIADASAAVTRRLRNLDPALIVLARAPFASQVEGLHLAGVQHVICDERETARALTPLLRLALDRDAAAPPDEPVPPANSANSTVRQD